MKTTAARPHTVTRLRRGAVCVAALLAAILLWSTGAQAQRLYRHVDEKGRVTYSDVAPNASATTIKAQPNVGSKEASEQVEMARRERRQLDAEERHAAQRRAAATRQLLPQPAPEPVVIPPRRGGYDSSLPAGQPASDSNRRY